MRAIAVRPIAYASPEYDAERILRNRILRQPIGLDLFAEDLSGEVNDIHLGAFDGARLVGVLVLTRTDAERVRMRQVAVDESCQRSGIGSALVAEAERFAREQGYAQMILHARQTALQFYERLGYTAEGEPFTEVGIAHIGMFKALSL